MPLITLIIIIVFNIGITFFIATYISVDRGSLGQSFCIVQKFSAKLLIQTAHFSRCAMCRASQLHCSVQRLALCAFLRCAYWRTEWRGDRWNNWN